MASDKLKVFNDRDFDEEVLRSAIPVLVDFSAEWCGPCKALTPILEQLAGELSGKVKFGTVDVDQSPAVAARYGVRSLPTLLLFKDGALAAKHAGPTTKAKLKAFVET
jgi:thioredoxin 1